LTPPPLTNTFQHLQSTDSREKRVFNKSLFACLILIATPATQGLAQGPLPGPFSGTPEEQAACRPDTRKLCRSLSADSGEIAFLQCLQQNQTKLSNPCREVLKRHGQI
jgi:hypothetical protein